MGFDERVMEVMKMGSHSRKDYWRKADRISPDTLASLILSRAEVGELHDPRPEDDVAEECAAVIAPAHRKVANCLMLAAALVAFVLLPIIAAFGGETERVRVAAAKTRSAMLSQAEMPDAPPNVVLPNVPNKPVKPTPKPRGMSLEIAGEPLVSGDDQQSKVHDVTLHTTTGCLPCLRMKGSLKSDPRLKVTEVVNTIPKGVPTTSFPFITFRDDSGTLRYNLTVRTADEVVRLIERNRSGGTTRRLIPDELKAFARSYTGPPVGVEGMTVRQHLMDANHRFSAEQLTGLTESEMLAVHAGHHYGKIQPLAISPPQDGVAVGSRRGRLEQPASSVGIGGVIHGREVISRGLDWWRSNIGDGTASVEWTRNGAQLLPLMRLVAWTPQAIYGTNGSFSFQLTGAPHTLPATDAVIGYRLVGDMLRLSGETSIPASVLGIDTSGPKAVGDAQPVGFVDPMTILSVASLVWGLLHPQADVTLPGAIGATATMRGDELVITFQQAPSVKIVMLFTFQLKVESVSISESKVVVTFSGSRFIRQKTFEVK
jgi:hypothetical protein